MFDALTTNPTKNMTTRQKCKKLMNKVCLDLCGLSLDNLPDLPCIMNALDEMEELVESQGAEFTTNSELYEVAQDAVSEVLEEEGFEF